MVVFTNFEPPAEVKLPGVFIFGRFNDLFIA
jgi:hypothetical protein